MMRGAGDGRGAHEKKINKWVREASRNELLVRAGLIGVTTQKHLVL